MSEKSKAILAEAFRDIADYIERTTAELTALRERVKELEGLVAHEQRATAKVTRSRNSLITYYKILRGDFEQAEHSRDEALSNLAMVQEAVKAMGRERESLVDELAGLLAKRKGPTGAAYTHLLKQRDDALGQLAEVLAMNAQWAEKARAIPHPMSTAPRDGTEIMAYHIDGKNYHPVAYLEGWWRMRWNAEYCCGDGFYSGWIPYPDKIRALPLEGE
jgi:hypothetical protein